MQLVRAQVGQGGGGGAADAAQPQPMVGGVEQSEMRCLRVEHVIVRIMPFEGTAC